MITLTHPSEFHYRIETSSAAVTVCCGGQAVRCRGWEPTVSVESLPILGGQHTQSIGTMPMRAITVSPGITNSARLEDVPPPPVSEGAILVRTLAIGVCGTDREIIAGEYGLGPPRGRRGAAGRRGHGRGQAAAGPRGVAARGPARGGG